MNIEEAIDIVERHNIVGKRLKARDVVSAEIPDALVILLSEVKRLSEMSQEYEDLKKQKEFTTHVLTELREVFGLMDAGKRGSALMRAALILAEVREET